MSGTAPCGVMHACGGSVYFERCCDQNDTDHEWAVAGECQRCGERYAHNCPECGATDRHGGAPFLDAQDGER